MKPYPARIYFQNRFFDVGILPKEVGFDLELSFNGSLTGEDYQKLRKYLIDEGYVDAAKKTLEQTTV